MRRRVTTARRTAAVGVMCAFIGVACEDEGTEQAPVAAPVDLSATAASTAPKATAVPTADAEDEAEKLRKQLLTSDDPKDWEKLVADFPSSEEAKLAQKRIRYAASLCGDPDEQLDVRQWVVKIADQTPKAMTSCLFSGLPSAGVIMCYLKEADAAEARSKALVRAQEAVKGHKLFKGEEDIRDGMVAELKKLAALNAEWVKVMRMVRVKLVNQDVRVVGDRPTQDKAKQKLAKETAAKVEKILERQRARDERCMDIHGEQQKEKASDGSQ